MRVVVCHEDPYLLAIVGRMAELRGHDVIAELGSPFHAIPAVTLDAPDAVVVGVGSSRVAGVAIAMIRRARPECRVIGIAPVAAEPLIDLTGADVVIDLTNMLELDHELSPRSR